MTKAKGALYMLLHAALGWLQRALKLTPEPEPVPTLAWVVVFDLWDDEWSEFMRVEEQELAHDVAMGICAFFARLNINGRAMVMPTDHWETMTAPSAVDQPVPAAKWN